MMMHPCWQKEDSLSIDLSFILLLINKQYHHVIDCNDDKKKEQR